MSINCFLQGCCPEIRTLNQDHSFRTRHRVGPFFQAVPVALFLGLLASLAAQEPQASVFEDALRATVQITSPKASGTGFFVQGKSEDEDHPGLLLVTAAHVFQDMPGESCTIMFRRFLEKNTYQRHPVQLKHRKGNQPLWQEHPNADLALIVMNPPPDVDLKPIALSRIAPESYARQGRLQVGQEICLPCFPARLAANDAGWPILRRGTIASHPLTPLSAARTYFVDISSFGGDSGAPVIAWEKENLWVVGVVTSMRRQTDKVTMPFEERTVHTPLGLSIAEQAPVLLELLDRFRTADAKP